MSLAHRRAIWILGLSQCVLWGILYYGYSIWQEPLVQTLGASRTAIAGAFSAGLGIMALLAPWIGRRIDEGRIVGVVRLGLALAVAGLALLSQSRNVPMVYAAYVLLGFAMASLLYETAFGLVTRAVVDEHQRLGALSTVTIFGGLASTVFLPLLAWASDTFGWRATGLACIPILLAGGWVLERYVVPPLGSARLAPAEPPAQPTAVIADGTIGFSLVFVACTVSAMSLAVLLIPKLHAAGASSVWAASALGAFGLAQLPGRIWLSRFGGQASVRWLTTVPLATMVLGLVVLAVATTVPLAFVGVGLFGFGSGLMTLARPWLVQRRYGVAHAGRVNGRIARHQGLARAIGPVAAVWISGFGHFDWVFGGLALALAVLTPVAIRIARAA